MNRLCVETRGIGNWRERLAKPDGQWKRSYSALETAVSWEPASGTSAGLPEPIGDLFCGTAYSDPTLILAIAEHKVPLPGGNADSQCDVWALVNTKTGAVSLSVEAKAKEPFGQDDEPLAKWLVAGRSEKSRQNRKVRWDYIKEHLPDAGTDGYSQVAYQLLHRCAAAVIEARRIRLLNAAFIVQAFESPPESFEAFSRLCQAMGLKAERGRLQITAIGNICLGIGWVDCPFATDKKIAVVV